MRAKPKKATNITQSASARKPSEVDTMPHYKGDKKAKTRVVTPDLALTVNTLNKRKKPRL